MLLVIGIILKGLQLMNMFVFLDDNSLQVICFKLCFISVYHSGLRMTHLFLFQCVGSLLL